MIPMSRGNKEIGINTPLALWVWEGHGSFEKAPWVRGFAFLRPSITVGMQLEMISMKSLSLKSCLLCVGLILVVACRKVSPGEEEASSLKAVRFPQRIISLSPNVSEILDGVGAFDRVVAISDYCTYPPAVKHLPRVGG